MKETTRPTALHEYPIVIELPIQWGELDAFGHVNNLVYLKWFESARAVYAMAVGVDIAPQQGGIGAILSSISCKYLRQLSFPGAIFAGIRVTRMSIGSVTLELMIVDASNGVPVASGNCDVVLYDFKVGKPVPVPDRIHAAVEALEGRSYPL